MTPLPVLAYHERSMLLSLRFQCDNSRLSFMPLYEYECAKGHRFEAMQKVKEKPLTKCSFCAARAHRIISQPTLLHNRGIHVFDRVTKDDIMHSRPSSLKSFKKDRF